MGCRQTREQLMHAAIASLKCPIGKCVVLRIMQISQVLHGVHTRLGAAQSCSLGLEPLQLKVWEGKQAELFWGCNEHDICIDSGSIFL